MKVLICILAIATFFLCFNICYSPPPQSGGGCHESKKPETQVAKQCCLTNAVLANSIHFLPAINTITIEDDPVLISVFQEVLPQVHPSTDPPGHLILRI